MWVGCDFQIIYFRRILSPAAIHSIYYTLDIILYQLIHSSSFLVNFPVLLINSIINIYYSIGVGSIGSVLVNSFADSFQNPSHILEIKNSVNSPPHFPYLGNRNDVTGPKLSFS